MSFLVQSHEDLFFTRRGEYSMADSASVPEGEEEEEVTAVLKSVLEKQGVLGKLKAQIRSCVYQVCAASIKQHLFQTTLETLINIQALDEGTAPKPQLSNDTLVMNELIREYLEYVKSSTSSSPPFEGLSLMASSS